MLTSQEGPSSGVVWSLVEDGFHVGSRGGEFLGYIDRQRDGSFVACDLYSREIGRFRELPAAMRAITAVHAVDAVRPSGSVR